MQQPLATCGYWTLDMQLVPLWDHSFQYCFLLINLNSYMWLVVTIMSSTDVDLNQYPNYSLIGFENFLNLYFILFVLIFQNISQSFYFQFRTFLGDYLLQYLSARLHFSIFQAIFTKAAKASGRANLWPARGYGNLCILALPPVLIPMATQCKAKCLSLPLFFS